MTARVIADNWWSRRRAQVGLWFWMDNFPAPVLTGWFAWDLAASSDVHVDPRQYQQDWSGLDGVR